MSGTRQRFKQGFALILNQCRQVTGTDRQQPSLEDDQDRENTASLTVKPNLTQQFVSTGTPKDTALAHTMTVFQQGRPSVASPTSAPLQ